MTDRHDPLDDTTPLGKSVEEVEQEGQNLVNSPVDSEDRRRRDESVPAIIPPFNQGGQIGSNFGVGVAAVPGLVGNLVGGDEGGADDGRNDKEEDDTPA